MELGYHGGIRRPRGFDRSDHIEPAVPRNPYTWTLPYVAHVEGFPILYNHTRGYRTSMLIVTW